MFMVTITLSFFLFFKITVEVVWSLTAHCSFANSPGTCIHQFPLNCLKMWLLQRSTQKERRLPPALTCLRHATPSTSHPRPLPPSTPPTPHPPNWGVLSEGAISLHRKWKGSSRRHNGGYVPACRGGTVRHVNLLNLLNESLIFHGAGGSLLFSSCC